MFVSHIVLTIISSDRKKKEEKGTSLIQPLPSQIASVPAIPKLAEGNVGVTKVFYIVLLEPFSIQLSLSSPEPIDNWH